MTRREIMFSVFGSIIGSFIIAFTVYIATIPVFGYESKLKSSYAIYSLKNLGFSNADYVSFTLNLKGTIKGEPFITKSYDSKNADHLVVLNYEEGSAVSYDDKYDLGNFSFGEEFTFEVYPQNEYNKLYIDDSPKPELAAKGKNAIVIRAESLSLEELNTAFILFRYGIPSVIIFSLVAMIWVFIKNPS